jgi:dihydrofolate reductase
MIISLIVAMDESRGIGLKAGLPWYLPADLKHFKSITMGHYLIMGRKTYETIGRPLPGRTMIVLTHNPEYQADGCIIAHSLESALELARLGGEEEVFVIGGGEIFAQALDRADKIYLTKVHATLTADVFFPKLSTTDWEETSSQQHPSDEKNPYPHSYKEFTRISR